MEKIIEKHLTITSVYRDVEKLGHEIYSQDKGTATFKFTFDELTASKVLCLFYFKYTKRYRTVEATISENTITVPFDSTLITNDEPVVGYVYFEKVEQSTDVYSFAFNVWLSAIDKARKTPLVERTSGRIVDVENIVTKQEIDELFAKIKEQGGTYDDSNLRTEISHISAEIETLKEKTDKDTVYDDSALKQRLEVLENKPEKDTSNLVTRQELENKNYLTTHQDISRLATKEEINNLVTKQELRDKNYLTSHQSLSDYALKSELPTPYNDLELKKRVERLESRPDLDTSNFVTNEVLNSKGYLTQHQSLEGYAKKSEIPQAYNDTEVKQRLSTIEQKGESYATKEQLVSIPKNPQKLTLSGNTLILSDGGGSVNLPTSSQNAPTPSTSSSELTGTGMPNGKVEGTLGQTYIDTAKTNGALKWIKRTHSGNQGWAVLDGDTGWKTLNSASKLGNSSVKARRINDIVQLQFGGLQWGWFGIVRRGGLGFVAHPGNREKKVFILTNGQMPYGYRTATSLIGPIYNDDGVSYGTWYLGGYGDANHLRFQFLDPIPTDKDIGDIRVSNISYFTDDPWPTV